MVINTDDYPDTKLDICNPSVILQYVFTESVNQIKVVREFFNLAQIHVKIVHEKICFFKLEITRIFMKD